MNRRLKAKIIERFGSQGNFAVVIGQDETIVSKVVNGRRSLNDEQRQQWASVLDCKEEILIYEIDRESLLERANR